MKLHIPLAPFAAIATLAVLSTACSRAKPTPVNYEKDGIKFTHLSDWKVKSDAPIENARNARIINLEGPDSAILMIICLPESAPATLESFASDVAGRRNAAIEEKFRVGTVDMAAVAKGTSEGLDQTIAGVKSTGIRQRFSITLFGVLVPHQADFFMLHHGSTKVVLMSQVAEKHLAEAEPNYRRIYDSLSLEGLQ